jgi:phytoene dehydrogenase-like protein
MARATRKIVIVGGGIAGLCSAVYARICGYEAELVEMHDRLGGLATSWQRDGYTFETCLHWLMGSNPAHPFHARWQEVFDIGRLTFVDTAEFQRIENERGDRLGILTDVDRMEAELLRHAPADAPEIRRFAAAIRRFTTFEIPDFSGSRLERILSLLWVLPFVPALRRWSAISIADYGKRFRNPLLRGFFGSGESSRLAALPLVLSMAWMSRHDAGYPVGGSQAVIRLIAERLAALAGKVRLGARVEKILVENGAATGVRLVGGEVLPADWVIGAGDGYATFHELLGGPFAAAADREYGRLQTFPSYLQVSLGIARDLSAEPGYLVRLLDEPLEVDPATRLSQLGFRIFNYDPSFAPPGKTAVTCFLPTRAVEHWTGLRERDPESYRQQKQRVAEAVIGVLERHLPGIRAAIEVVDVSSPATVIRYTGNWRGSMEGWLLLPGMSFQPLPAAPGGLQRFRMVGQWALPGGGLPSGLLTARAALRAICREDGVRFAV